MTMSSLNILIDSNSLQQRIIAFNGGVYCTILQSPLQDFESTFMTDTITDTTYLPTVDIPTEIPRNQNCCCICQSTKSEICGRLSWLFTTTSIWI